MKPSSIIQTLTYLTVLDLQHTLGAIDLGADLGTPREVNTILLDQLGPEALIIFSKVFN